MVEYLNESEIQDMKATPAPKYGRNVDGYGKKIPSAAMYKIKNRWRRVYVTLYSNAGSAWVIVGGKKLYLRN